MKTLLLTSKWAFGLVWAVIRPTPAFLRHIDPGMKLGLQCRGKRTGRRHDRATATGLFLSGVYSIWKPSPQSFCALLIFPRDFLRFMICISCHRGRHCPCILCTPMASTSSTRSPYAMHQCLMLGASGDCWCKQHCRPDHAIRMLIHACAFSIDWSGWKRRKELERSGLEWCSIACAG